MLDFDNWSDDRNRNGVIVKWRSGMKATYRVGHNGKIDLKATTPAVWMSMYYQHLPVLDLSEKRRPIPIQQYQAEKFSSFHPGSQQQGGAQGLVQFN